MSEELLTVAEAAAKLSVSNRTIQRYCKQGLLNHKWIAGKRHKELRIIPPIPVSQLPGVKKKRVLSKFDVENMRMFYSEGIEMMQELKKRDNYLNFLLIDIIYTASKSIQDLIVLRHKECFKNDVFK